MGTSAGLSVVLPLYNGAPYVEAAIQSIIEQHDLPQNWEIIVVDDGSTDSGLKICQRLTRIYPQIIIEQHPDNRGVAAARNRGVEIARYEYLAFIDQDDRWVPHKWRVQFQALSETKAEYALGYKQFELLNPNNPPSWFRASWIEAPQKGYVFGAMLIAKRDFLKVGRLREEYMYGYDDVDWFVRMKQSGLKGIMLDDVVLYANVHDHNASARTKQSNQELLRLIRAKLACRR